MSEIDKTPAEVVKTANVADNSFKAGYEKAKREMEAKANKAKFEKQSQRLAELESKETERLKAAEIKNLVVNLKLDEMADTGLRGAGAKLFAEKHLDDLKNLNGNELVAKVKQIKDNSDKDTIDLFFGSTNVNASNELLAATKADNNTGNYEYLPGSSIKIKK